MKKKIKANRENTEEKPKQEKQVQIVDWGNSSLERIAQALERIAKAKEKEIELLQEESEELEEEEDSEEEEEDEE